MGNYEPVYEYAAIYVCMHEEYKYSLSLLAVIGRESGILDSQNANESLYSCFPAV